jgi:hypothetical protein
LLFRRRLQRAFGRHLRHRRQCVRSLRPEEDRQLRPDQRHVHLPWKTFVRHGLDVHGGHVRVQRDDLPDRLLRERQLRGDVARELRRGRRDLRGV